jgi:WD40 repeat protein
MRETILDAFRFVSKFYELIKRSALHTYHSALVFTPIQQPLYKRHCEEMTHKACWLRGGLVQWDPLVATCRHPGTPSVRFSWDGSQLASLASKDTRFWDATSGTPISSSNLGEDDTILAADFSTVAIPCNDTIKLYNVATDMAVATFTHSWEVVKLTLSHDGSRLATALSNHTIRLWDVQKDKSIATLDGSSAERLTFSPRNCILASLSIGGEIGLWNGMNGDFIACLDHGQEKHVEFAFSRDGSRLASLTKNGEIHSLTLWNGENGNFIDEAENVGDVYRLAISDDGSFVAAAEVQETAKLWSADGGNRLSLIDSIEIGEKISLAFSRDLLAIAAWYGDIVKLFDLRSRTIISTLKFLAPISLAISPDGTRLAAGNFRGEVHLWDIASIKATNPASNKELSPVNALALSPDCSRLAAGLEDGTIELWNTDQAEQLIATLQQLSRHITALAFSPDGEQLASGSQDGTVRVWDGRDGSTSNVIEHAFPGRIYSFAFSNGLFASATEIGITIWDRKTLLPIDTIHLSTLSLPFSYVTRVRLSFQVGGSSLLAIACEYGGTFVSNVTVWDTGERTALATFKGNCSIRELTLSPDGSLAFAKLDYSGFRLFDVSTGNAIQQTGRADLNWIPNFDGIPISWNSHDNHIIGQFSERSERISLLRFPAEVRIWSVVVGSSMFSVGCRDGRLLLVRS